MTRAATIERKRKNAKFAEVMNRGKAKGRISVRRQQMKLLEAGNATMGVWLGKNILGQVDEVRHELSGGLAYLSVILPRALTLAGSGAQPLIDAGEADSPVEIEPADYETAADNE